MNQNEEAERRVLDMLAGWCDFLMRVGYVPPESAQQEEERVAELYQQFGRKEPPSLEEIEKFLKDKVIPFILNGK